MDENRYPAFNGIFKGVVYSNKKGAFIEAAAELKTFQGNVPDVSTQFSNTKVLAGQTERTPVINPI